MANLEDTTAWEFGDWVGRVTWTGVGGTLHPRTSLRGIGLTLQAVCVTSTGVLCMHMFMVMAMSGRKKKKQEEGEKRESICRTRDISLRFWTTYLLSSRGGRGVGELHSV